MLLDTNLEIADALSIAAAAGTAVLANAIDLSAAAFNPDGAEMYLVIQVTTAVTSAGAATVQFALVSDSTDPASTDGSETQHWISKAIPKATLVAGYTIIVPLPFGSPAYERYLQLEVITGTATTTAGAINAFLTTEPSLWRAYPQANN